MRQYLDSYLPYQLEAEVYTLKTRLDALRKAKNTTIIKGGVVKSGENNNLMFA